jgi:hypothetical protein
MACTRISATVLHTALICLFHALQFKMLKISEGILISFDGH